jgi:hypothetical protein
MDVIAVHARVLAIHLDRSDDPLANELAVID